MKMTEGVSCKNGNHVIGCAESGILTVDTYIETDRKHPGRLFQYCPDCGCKIFIDDIADTYEKNHYDPID